MLDLYADISELSSCSSYPNSPSASSQILFDTTSGISQIFVDNDDDEHLNGACRYDTLP